MSSNWLSWLHGSTKSTEVRDTLNLLERVKADGPVPGLSGPEEVQLFVVDLIFDICERLDVVPSIPLGRALHDSLIRLLLDDGLLLDCPSAETISSLTLEEGVALRASLNRRTRFIGDAGRLLPMWREKVVGVFAGLLEYFPLSAFVDPGADGTSKDDSVVFPEARVYDLCENLPEVLDRLIISFFDVDLKNAHLFQPLRDRLNRNGQTASGIPTDRPSNKDIKYPSEHKKVAPEYLVSAYLQGTPFLSFFTSTLPFAIPFPARFEHTHVVGGTGHGKTQLLQFLINHDLVRSTEDGRSVVVIDSQGDLIRTFSQLHYFDPGGGNLADRFVLVDPNDVEHPVCLNMFDFNRERLSHYQALDREKILNATIELYEYFFGSLLGAELTQRQGVIFKYLAKLLIEIPDATIHTLRELMEDGEKFRPYMEKLTGSTRGFYATRFFDRQFADTKKQILARLWGVLANSSLERMFSHRQNKVDIFELMNAGKIIFINTAKDLLGQEGAAIFGRFFIALISQAAVQRATQRPHERRPTFVYIDEAQDYFDENISNLLNQARKYHVGLVFAHQNLDQLDSRLRASVLSSTSIKFAGGLSAKDAGILDSELRCDSSFLLAQRKGPQHTEFACHVKNFTERALSVRVPLGYVETLPKLDADGYELLVGENRERYSAPPELPEDVPFTSPTRPVERETRQKKRSASAASAPPTSDQPRPVPAYDSRAAAPTAEAAPTSEPTSASEALRRDEPTQPRGARPKDLHIELPQPGRGGREHKHLQSFIKLLGEERGFRAGIEDSILGGNGRVDVSLFREQTRIAFEISVTTGQDQELANIEKCFAAGFTDVVLVGSNQRHIKTLSRFIEENLDEGQRGRVRYLGQEELVEYLDSFGIPPTEVENIRGWKVRTTQKISSAEDAEARRKAIAEILARSQIRKPRD